MMKWYTKWLSGMILAGLCAGLTMPLAEAARISDLQGGVTPKRARLVLSVDEAIRYRARIEDKQLIFKLKGSTDRTRQIHLQDIRIKKAYIEPDGRNSRLVILFRKGVPEYKVFSLKHPERLVIDFPKSGGGDRTAQRKDSRQWLGKGLTYSRATVNLGGGPVRTYTLTLAPDSEFKLAFIPGYGKTIQKGILTKIGERSGASALVNASYFDSEIWVIGNLKIEDKWLGMEATPRTGLVLDKAGRASVQPALAYSGTLTRPDGKTYPIGGINRMRLAGEIIMYNDGYGTSTDTNRYGTEVRVRDGKVIEVRNGGNMPLYSGSTVFSGNGAGAVFLRRLKKGDALELSQTLGNAAADAAPSVGTAGPQLVYDGRVAVTSEQEQIASDIAWGRAPRTAVGVKKDGTVLIVVADGRSDYSAGMSLEELARFFLRLGADRAMNFDGGGSSEMVVNGRVMNDPSDGDERPVRVALGVIRK